MKKYKNVFCTVIVFCFFTINFINVNAKTIYEYYSDGVYTNGNINQSNLCFYVDQSASNIFGTSVFSSAYNWNNISSNVGVTAIASYPAPASQYSSYFFVEGTTSLGTAFGETFYYNSSGNLVSFDSANIYKIKIRMNSNTNIYLNSSANFRKVFTHEVGHALLLKHPSVSYFSSIMHQGLPSSGTVISSTITTNDQNALRYKWGN